MRSGRKKHRSFFVLLTDKQGSEELQLLFGSLGF